MDRQVRLDDEFSYSVSPSDNHSGQWVWILWAEDATYTDGYCDSEQEAVKAAKKAWKEYRMVKS